MDKIIYHIVSKEYWNEATTEDSYKPETFDLEEFIHCSNREQIVDVANAFYEKEKGLLLVCIDATKVEVDIVYENLIGGTIQFPHLYGPLNLNAVTRIVDFLPDDNGRFAFPEDAM